MIALLVLASFLQDHHWLKVVNRYWVEAGVIDKDDMVYVTSWQTEYDAETIQLRLSEVPADAPPLAAKNTLPPQEYIDYAHAMQYRFRAYIEAAYQYRNYAEQWELDQILEDLQERMKVWRAIDLCRNRHNRMGARHAMWELKQLVGADIFDKAQYPHPLPAAALNSHWEFDITEPMEIP